MNFQELTNDELKRQEKSINLIASENYPSPKTLDLMGSIWSVKYGEGYPGKRYYAGNQNTDKLESEVQKLALEVFANNGHYGVNLQALSGSVANSLIYLSILDYGDKILSLRLDQGGHLSHLHKTSNWNKFFEYENYSVSQASPNQFEIDMEGFKNKIAEYKPKLVIIGFSSYPKKCDFNKMCSIAHEYGALVLADISHINGLVAVGLHSSPLETKSGNFEDTADLISMTTHKTMRGPRNAMIFARNDSPEFLKAFNFSKPLISLINQAIFPGVLGGPHFNKIAALGQSLKEILGEDQYPGCESFKSYMKKVLENCKALESGMRDNGVEIISDTQTHLCLIKLPSNLDSLEFQKDLESINIITNRNSLPFDEKTPYRPSGIRFGTSAITSRGATKDDCYKLGCLISDLINGKDKVNISTEVNKIIDNLHFYY